MKVMEDRGVIVKIIMARVFLFMLLLAGCGTRTSSGGELEVTVSSGNTSESTIASRVQIDYGASDLYTKEDMNAAIELILQEFNTWDGCEMQSISYSSDDECSEYNIKWMNDMEKATEAKETFTQCIMFKSNFHSPIEGGGAWCADEDYTDWHWWLARSEGSAWKLMTWGY